MDANGDADLLGLRRLALWAGQRYAPVVAVDPPDGLWVDVTGAGSPSPTPQAVRTLWLVRCLLGGQSSSSLAKPRKAIALLPTGALRLNYGVVKALRKLGFDRVE